MKTIYDWIKLVDELKTFLESLVPKKQDVVPVSKYIAILCAGHGGIDPDGVYTTNGKFWTHKKGNFHKGSTFLEGVFNRDIIDKHLIPMLKAARIEYVRLHHDYLDTPLAERTRIANAIKHKKSFGISCHSNAFNTKARGFSVFTSPGITLSDTIAKKLLEEMDLLTKKFNFTVRRNGTGEFDGDYETLFWMLRKTNMPFILPECLFFDNYEDAMILMNHDFQVAYAKALFNTIVWVMNNMEL